MANKNNFTGYIFTLRYVCLFMVKILFVAVFFIFAMTAQAELNVISSHDALKNHMIEEIEFKQSKVSDAIRIISELTHVNIVSTNSASEKIFSLFLRELSVLDVIDSIARVAGLWYRYNPKTGVYILMTTKEYVEDMVVLRDEVTRIFVLKYQNVVAAAQTIKDLYGTRVNLTINDEAFDSLKLSDIVSRSGIRRGGGSGSGTQNASINREGLKLTANQLEHLQTNRSGESLQIAEESLSSFSKREISIFVTINRLHNLLFVRSSDNEAMRDIEIIIAESDIPISQVLLEMKVMSIDVGDDYAFGLNFTAMEGENLSGPTDSQWVNPLKKNSTTGTTNILGLVNTVLTEENTGTLVYQWMNDKIRLRLNMLDRNKRINTLSTPMLLASNNQAARIFIGQETVLTTGFSSGGVTVIGNNSIVTTVPTPQTEVREVGNTLTILPSINADRSVVMRVFQEASTVKLKGASIPVVVDNAILKVPIDTIATSRLEGTIQAQDGMMVAIGGMIVDNDVEIENRVPFLGDIPIIGKLFRSKTRDNSKNELVLLITPHVLDTAEQSEDKSRERMDELLNHPNAVDLYLDKMDKRRAKVVEQKKSKETTTKETTNLISGVSLDEAKISVLYEQAREDILANRLSQPAGRNAYDKLKQIESIDVIHLNAKILREEIYGAYIVLIKNEMLSGQNDKLKLWLQRADEILPNQQTTREIRTQLAR